MASDIRYRLACAVAFILIITMTTEAAPLSQDTKGCAHTFRTSTLQGNMSSLSAKTIRSAILSVLQQVRTDSKEGLAESSPPRNQESDNAELLVLQNLLTSISRQKEEPAKAHRPQRCGKRCRRRRRHYQRLKDASEMAPLSLRSLRTKPDSNILKSNTDAVVITKDSNIIRKDWCKTEPLKQQIRLPGCRPKTVMNNFCYGQCNSFFIPNSEVRDSLNSSPGTNTSNSPFKSCAVCKPRMTSWVTVTLNCPGLIPPTRTKKILKVHKCRCQAEPTR